jgi:hypothetical protein
MSEPLIHDPGNEGRIDRVYVFLSIDEEGNNGIIAEILPGLGSTPLVTGALKTAEVMKQMAEKVAERTGKPVGMFAFRRETQLWQTEAGS